MWKAGFLTHDGCLLPGPLTEFITDDSQPALLVAEGGGDRVKHI